MLTCKHTTVSDGLSDKNQRDTWRRGGDQTNEHNPRRRRVNVNGSKLARVNFKRTFKRTPKIIVKSKENKNDKGPRVNENEAYERT